MRTAIVVSVAAVVLAAVLLYVFLPRAPALPSEPAVAPPTPVVPTTPAATPSLEFSVVATREGFEPSSIAVPKDALVTVSLTNLAPDATYQIDGQEVTLARGEGTTLRFRPIGTTVLQCTRGCDAGVMMLVEVQ